jgi:hypothetical protein
LQNLKAQGLSCKTVRTSEDPDQIKPGPSDLDPVAEVARKREGGGNQTTSSGAEVALR